MATVWTPSDVDVVTWVPLSPRRRAERGFDQAHELASVVAPRLGLPALALLARDADDRSTQARRDRAGRLAAMEGRFRVRVPVRGTVLLVDDVLATGATASACAAVLERGGADRVTSSPRPGLSRRGPRRRCPPLGEGTGSRRRARVWVCGCPGIRSPVVDASRGRNDPRKATLGRRAWRGLDVSPAPAGRPRRERGRSPSGGDPPGRRVWGQRPGQPDASPFPPPTMRGSALGSDTGAPKGTDRRRRHGSRAERAAARHRPCARDRRAEVGRLERMEPRVDARCSRGRARRRTRGSAAPPRRGFVRHTAPRMLQRAVAASDVDSAFDARSRSSSGRSEDHRKRKRTKLIGEPPG